MSKIKKQKIAVFDIDGTIFRSSLLIELVEALIQEKIFFPRIRKIYLNQYYNWLNRKGHYSSYIEAVVKAFEKNIKGVSYSKLQAISKKVVAIHKDRVYCYTRDLIKKLKADNYYLLAISHSPLIIVESFAKELGFNKIYGRMFELDKNGKFTKRVLYKELVDDKAKILVRVLKKEKLNLKKSVGVGDTDSDISFLKIVDHPVCFNPNRKLYQYAKRKGWKIIVERKDVIYEITI